MQMINSQQRDKQRAPHTDWEYGNYVLMVPKHECCDFLAEIVILNPLADD